jgi:uncharacterized membrane protein required for colicin V production
MKKVDLFAAILVVFISFVIACFGFISLIRGVSLEPVSMVITGMFGVLSAIVGYYWGNSQKEQPHPDNSKTVTATLETTTNTNDDVPKI